MRTSYTALKTAGLAMMLCLGAAVSAGAAPILAGSTLNFAGQSDCTAAGCTFGTAFVTSGTGSFGGFTFGTAATFFPLSFLSFTPGQTYSTTNPAGQTASFLATARDSFSTDRIDGLTSYTITDAGLARLTGFDDTPGFYLFTANQMGTLQGSFSATSDAVPSVPETGVWAMMIAGFGLAGLGLRRRQRAVTRVACAV